MAERITPGIWRHYKKHDYQVFGEARNSETGEVYVLYKPLYKIPDADPEQLVVRSKEMFLEEVEVDGQMVPRFHLIEGNPNPLNSI